MRSRPAVLWTAWLSGCGVHSCSTVIASARRRSEQTAPGRFLITIHEGRNRQIRRMCAAAGLEVLRLRRIAEGPLQLGTLAPGAWRPLTEAELAALRQETEGGDPV